jgi:hypothetical protein
MSCIEKFEAFEANEISKGSDGNQDQEFSNRLDPNCDEMKKVSNEVDNENDPIQGEEDKWRNKSQLVLCFSVFLKCWIIGLHPKRDLALNGNTFSDLV